MATPDPHGKDGTPVQLQHVERNLMRDRLPALVGGWAHLAAVVAFQRPVAVAALEIDGGAIATHHDDPSQPVDRSDRVFALEPLARDGAGRRAVDGVAADRQGLRGALRRRLDVVHGDGDGRELLDLRAPDEEERGCDGGFLHPAMVAPNGAARIHTGGVTP